MRKIIIIALLTLCLGNAIAQNTDTLILEKIEAVDKELNKVLEISKAAGFAIAIVKGKEVIYAKGFGYRDLENKLPVTPNTVFAIGSTTKAFTASLMGILEDKGKVDLNESPRTYIPELQFYNSEMNKQITIKDLMTHSTGLPRHDGSAKIFTTNSKSDLITRLKFQEPVVPVRSKWIYNNNMYMLQGAITERLTNKTWAQNIENILFQPLDMENSSTNITDLEMNREAALGYIVEDGKNIEIDYFDLTALEPAGAINSSVNDMSKWMIAWLNSGKYNKQQVLPSNFVKQALSSQMIISGRFPRKSDPSSFMNNYGYGWFLASYKGHYRADHSGNIDGFTATISLYPADELGIVVLANQNRSGLTQTVRNLVTDILLETPETEDWMARLAKYVKQQIKIQEVKTIASKDKPLGDLKKYTGFYNHRGYGTFEVVIENGSLFAKFPSKKLWLNTVQEDVFDTYYVLDGKVETKYKDKTIRFMTTVEGDVSGLSIGLERTLKPIVFRKKSL